MPPTFKWTISLTPKWTVAIFAITACLCNDSSCPGASVVKIYVTRNQNNLLMWQQSQQVMYMSEVISLRCMRWRWLTSFDIISNTPYSFYRYKNLEEKIMNIIHNWHYCVKSGAKLILKLFLAVLCVFLRANFCLSFVCIV